MRRLISFLSYIEAWLFNLLPDSVFRFFSWCLAILWVDVLRLRRKVVYENIDKAFPGRDLSTKKKWMRFSIFVLAKNLFDLFRVPFVNEKWIDKNVIFHGAENAQAIQGGCFFLSIHMASGDLAAAAISHKVKPLSLISKRFSNLLTDEFWFSLRRRSKTQFIDAHSMNNAFEILKALRNNRGVVFVLDQFMGKPFGVESDFFGHKTGTAYGLALFAQKTKKPVLPLYTYWDNQHRLNVVIKPVIDLSSVIVDDMNISNAQVTNLFNREIEEMIKTHPEHWMWVHRRWKVFE